MKAIQYNIKTPIDEYFKPLPVPADSRFIDINLVSLGHINSTGIKTWVEWVQSNKIHSPDLFYRISNCPKVFIDQVNMVEGFLPERCLIESFSVPYYCEKCDMDVTKAYRVGEQFKWEGNAWAVVHPKVVCEKNPCAIEIDTADKYFNFLTIMGHGFKAKAEDS
jgi:hypothetical protein